MAAVLPDWVMLDRFIFIRDADVSLPDKDYAPLMAEGTTSQGVPFRIALCLAEPPATSRLYVLFPSGPEPGIGCDLVAAHGNLFLFGINDIVKTDDPTDDRLCSQDHFISRVTSPYQPLLLKRLPVCTERFFMGLVDGKERTIQRLFFPNAVGLLARDEQEFAVAQLDGIRQISASSMMEAEISALHTRVSWDGNDDGAMWEVKRLPILHPEHEVLDIFGWSTATVIPFKNYICTVDYYIGGILFFDVFEERPKVSYLGLPIQGRSDQPYESKSYLEMHRSVCVTGDGHLLKFVHVDSDDGKLFDPVTPVSGFTITSHTLKTTESGGMEWVKDATMKSDKVWPFICPNSACPPHNILTFPLVNMEKARLVHFLLYEPTDDDIDKVSVVTIDMNTETVVSIDPYITGDEDRCGEEADMLMHKYCLPKGFLPSKFTEFSSVTRYLHLAYLFVQCSSTRIQTAAFVGLCTEHLLYMRIINVSYGGS